MACEAWLALHASHFSVNERISLQLVLDFLEIDELNDLLALDEQALTYACTHKPSKGLPGFFKIADVCRLRQVLSSSEFPNFRHSGSTCTPDQRNETTSSTVLPIPNLRDSHSPIHSVPNVVGTIPNIVTLPPLSTRVPLPPDPFSSPVAHPIPRDNDWTLVRTINLTERLNAHLGTHRLYYNGRDYYMKEWPVVIKLLWPHICDDPTFDCFWNWRDPTPVPQRLAWHKTSCSYPPFGAAPFGVEYSCDFVTTCGCPKKMRVLRSRGNVSIFVNCVEVHLPHNFISMFVSFNMSWTT